MRPAICWRQRRERRAQEACRQLFPATTSQRSGLHSAKDAGELYRAWASLFRLLHHGADLLFCRELGATPDGGIAEFRVIALKREPADDVLREQAVVQMMRIFASL